MEKIVLNNRYELIELVGKGGMGKVYKAKCNLLNRYVAIKILDDKLSSDKEFVKRFKMESQSAASLSHQNIVSVYDVGFENNYQYIVMEYINGITLKKFIERNGALNWKKAVSIFTSICLGIKHASENKIIHRDVKPQNILVSNNNDIKITDFGIAKAISNSTITLVDTVFGTVHYFSPEQARGEYVDVRSDIYSMGITLYEMVTGFVPFDGDDPLTITLKHFNKKPKPPIEINRNIPSGLNYIILKSIKKKMDNRYQNIDDLLADLEKIKVNPENKFFRFKVIEKLKLDKLNFNKNTNNEIYEKKESIGNYNFNDMNESSNQSIESPYFSKNILSFISRRKKKIVIFSIGLIITILFTSLLLSNKSTNNNFQLEDYKLINKVEEKDEYIEIPNLKGLSYIEAKNLVESLDFKIGRVYPENPDDYSTITSQNPESGFNAKKGLAIDIYFKVDIESTISIETPVPTIEPSKIITIKPSPKLYLDDGVIEVMTNWFNNKSEPYVIDVKYTSIDNSDMWTTANWTYNSLDQIPDTLKVNGLSKGLIYKRVIKVNNEIVDNRDVSIN